MSDSPTPRTDALASRLDGEDDAFAAVNEAIKSHGELERELSARDAELAEAKKQAKFFQNRS